MARPAEPGRTALLDAGTRFLAASESRGWSGLSANAVVSEAAMSKGAFFHHFPTRKDFVVELHTRFHLDVSSTIDVAIRSMSPSADRLAAGINAYLNFCLTRAEAKAFLFEARADVDLRESVSTMNKHFASLMEADLKATGWKNPKEMAHLVVAAVAEVALFENEIRRASRRHRQALWALLRLA